MINKYLLSILLCCVAFFYTTKAQQVDRIVSKAYNEATSLVEVHDFRGAIEIFHEVLNQEPTSVEVLYYIGYSFLNIGQPDSATFYYKKALALLPVENRTTDIGVDIQYGIAKSNQLHLKSEEAIVEYNQLLTVISADNEVMKKQINREIETCHNAIELVKKPVVLEVKNIGPQINTSLDDHSPLISADGKKLFYTTRQENDYSDLMPDGQYSEKVFFSSDSLGQWSKGQIVTKLFQRDGHDAGVSLSADGQELYLTRTDMKGSNLYVCLYDGSSWSEPTLLPRDINTDYDETHATLSPDNSVMYFTSNRPNGFGGLDIYRVRRLPNGNWAVPQNLGADINSPYDEETPILHPDGRTLYFASEGHNSMGGFDIFISRSMADSSWTKPINMGYPINTPDDDFFFVPTVNQNQAYYASSRFNDSYGGMDIYLVQYEEPEDSRLAVMKGQIFGENELPIETIRVFVSDKATNEVVGQYRPHPGSGSFIMILESDKEYEVRYSGDGFEDLVTNLNVNKSMTYVNVQNSVKIDDITMLATPIAPAIVPSADTNGLQEPVYDGIPFYTVQILTIKKPVDSWDTAFRGLNHSLITEYKCKRNVYRYSYGKYKGYKASLKGKEEVLKLTPYSDSFIRDVKQYDELLDNDGK